MIMIMIMIVIMIMIKIQGISKFFTCEWLEVRFKLNIMINFRQKWGSKRSRTLLCLMVGKALCGQLNACEVGPQGGVQPYLKQRASVNHLCVALTDVVQWGELSQGEEPFSCKQFIICCKSDGHWQCIDLAALISAWRLFLIRSRKIACYWSKT